MSAWGVGDQDNATRRAFWAELCKKCPKCGRVGFNEERIVDGVRMNGDACGKTVFTCPGCSWKTSFLWDESSDNYWYETVGWKVLDEFKG
jgi:RNase P subunit RPR2